MDSASIILTCAGCLALAVGIAATPALAAADPPQASRLHRNASLDGLRGFLALAVVLHHGIIYRPFLRTGDWSAVPGFSSMLGQGGVAMFFMLTGYLFWGRLISRRGRPDWLQLYVGRVFRIGPLYLVAVMAALLVTFLAAPGLRVSHSALLGQVGPYFMLGALPTHDVNGFATPLLLAKVVWSLRYEWLFYLALPALAVLARSTRWHLAFAAAGLVGALASLSFLSGTIEEKMLPISVALFSIGMISASLHAHGFGQKGYGRLGSAIALVLVVVSLTYFPSAHSRLAMLTLGAFFYLVASGCTLFGVLTSRVALRLGEISYGIYLLQGLALAAVLRPAPMRALAIGSPVWYGVLFGLSTIVLILGATVLHVTVERRGMRFGRVVAAWAAARRPLVALSPEGLEPR